MATLEDLIDSFEQADAAGDVESAQALADEIRKLEQQGIAVIDKGVEEERREIRQAKRADVLRSIPSGAAKGLIGLAGLPGEIERGAESLAKYVAPESAEESITKYFDALGKLRMIQSPYLAATGGRLPTTEQVQAGVEIIPGAEAVTQYQPKTTAGEYAQTISEYTAPGGLFVRGPKSALQLGSIGLTTGTTAEALEQAEAPIWAQLPLTLAVGGVTGYLTSPNRSAKIANAALKGSSDEEIATAIQLEKELLEAGYKNITAPELIDNKILQRVAAEVYADEGGAKIMFNKIKNRPEELKNETQKLLNLIAKNPNSLRGAYEKIGTTAKKAVSDARAERKITSRSAGYIVADKEFVNEDQVLSLIDRIDNEILLLGGPGPNAGQTVNTLKEFKNRIIKSKEKIDDEITLLDDSGLPFTQKQTKEIITPHTNIKILDKSLREFRKTVDDFYLQQSQKQPTGLSSDTRNILSNSAKTGVLDDLDNILQTNVNYSRAKNTFKKLSNELVTPVQKNVKELAKGDVTPSKIKSFIFNPAKNNVDDIKKTYTILNKTDKEAFPLLARVYIENAAENAFMLGEKGQSLKTGFKLYQELAGTGAKERNFKQILKGVAEAQGVDPAELITGFRNLNAVLSRAGRITNIDSPGVPIKQLNLPREFLTFNSFMYRVKIGGKLDEAAHKRAMRQIANIFTKPNSVEELVKLGKTAVGSSDSIKRTAYILTISDPLRETDTTNNLIQAPPE